MAKRISIDYRNSHKINALIIWHVIYFVGSRLPFHLNPCANIDSETESDGPQNKCHLIKYLTNNKKHYKKLKPRHFHHFNGV